MFFTRKKKVFILLGHPDTDSFNCTLADEYEKGALDAGHQVRRMNISDMQFDPILHHGYRLMQELEPDLHQFQENMRWCEHFTVFYPSWWSTMPALLKGLFDRTWLPGFAFRFTAEFSWRKLLKGRSASMVVTSDTIPLAQRIIFGDTTNELRRGILWFAGFSPIHLHKIGYLKHFRSTGRRERIKRKAYNLGQKAK
ncbi:MAG: NAD(P)H-dependent oxidoreductase [Patescibacteria group bacterium]